ncbi:MAG: CRISPR-associated helicase Cas3' [Truepera sp.]|nr:CRISPR-associated helicase Cas3' [Truepera sp.]
MKRPTRPAAHTPKQGDLKQRWHYLDDHLKGVAAQAEAFTRKFGEGTAGRLAGLLHDIGKLHPEFQRYLEAQYEGKYHSGQPHAIWGALMAYLLLDKDSWIELAPVIAGHHAGLKAVGILKDDIERLSQKEETWEVIRELSKYLEMLGPPEFALTKRAMLGSELRTRMLLSALVDADYSDTEQHCQPDLIPPTYPDLKVLWRTFKQNQKGLIEELDSSAAQNRVNQVRQEVYRACCQVATNPPGFYRLTAPTGAGKTRAALAFALKHALSQRTPLDRIVFAIPYTNIIKQTANDYREIFEPLGQVILEHHSQVEATEGEVRYSIPNWSESLIITTNVQLFESLFTRRPGKARKLHNLNRSVIILDEAQTLPAHILEPTLDVLRELVENYGVSVVFCTATQPEYEGAPQLKKHFDALDITEIVPNYPEHFDVLKRVDYTLRPSPLTWEKLARELAQEENEQVLVVLNTRRDVLILLDELKKQNVPHLKSLSTLLCPKHQNKVLAEVRDCLKNGNPVRLVSTQVVEAGVDFDFPRVYRAIGPLDRIIQAAGRCNREGELPYRGQVIVFETVESREPQGFYAMGTKKTRFLLREHADTLFDDPELCRAYFASLYGDAGAKLDANEVQEHRRSRDFPEVDSRYKLIEDDTSPVVVQYGDWEIHLEGYLDKPSRHTWQTLQAYVVNLYRYDVGRLDRDGLLKRVVRRDKELELFAWDGAGTGYDSELKGFDALVRDPSDLLVYKDDYLVR